MSCSSLGPPKRTAAVAMDGMVRRFRVGPVALAIETKERPGSKPRPLRGGGAQFPIDSPVGVVENVLERAIQERCHLASGEVPIGAVPVVVRWVATDRDSGSLQRVDVVLEHQIGKRRA